MEQYTLGKSEKVLQFTQEEIINADIKLNRYNIYNERLLVDSFTYATGGALYGTLLSTFFRNKVGVIGYATGFAIGLAIHRNANQLIKHVRKE